MEYNSAREQLLMPEYGRNIQKMVQYAMSLEDREERSKLARSIVSVMAQLNPQMRDIADFKHKLWDHLFYISDFKLDVDAPYPKPDPSTYKLKPKPLQYPGKQKCTIITLKQELYSQQVLYDLHIPCCMRIVKQQVVGCHAIDVVK